MGDTSPTKVSRTERRHGMVKWFNSQAGYGFIAMKTSGDETEDLFVHHTGLKTNTDMFRYLVEGEYVGYGVKTIRRSGEDKLTAYEVTGIDGGPLQCETRHNRRAAESARSALTNDDQCRSSRRGAGSPNSAKLWSVVQEQF